MLSGELGYMIGTGSGRVGMGLLGGTATWAALPEQEWIADVLVTGIIRVVRADGRVLAFDLDLQRLPAHDLELGGDEKVIRARLDGPDHLVLTRYSGRTDRWNLWTGRPAPANGIPQVSGDESGWVTVGGVRVDVGAAVRDLLQLADGRIAVATGLGIVLLAANGCGHSNGYDAS